MLHNPQTVTCSDATNFVVETLCRHDSHIWCLVVRTIDYISICKFKINL